MIVEKKEANNKNTVTPESIKTFTTQLHALIVKILEEYEKGLGQESESTEAAQQWENLKNEFNDLIKAEEERKLEREKMPSCAVCLEVIEKADIFPLGKCGHVFHCKCLSESMIQEVKEKKLPLKCPSCPIEVIETDIKKLLPSDAQKKWDRFTLEKLVESNPGEYSYCLTPGCEHIFHIEKDKEGKAYPCPMCKKNYCLKCKCIYHEGKSCKHFQVENSITVSFQNKLLGGR